MALLRSSPALRTDEPASSRSRRRCAPRAAALRVLAALRAAPRRPQTCWETSSG